MDAHKLRSLVFEKTGIKIDATDPVFALVALNESILEETLKRHLALLSDARVPGALMRDTRPALQAGASSDDWEADPAPAPEPVREHASAVAANGPDDAMTTSTPAPASSPGQLHAPAPGSVPALFNPRNLAILFAMMLCSNLLVLAGHSLFAANKPLALSAEQTRQLQQADKLAKAINKLDAKSRALIAEELNKP